MAGILAMKTISALAASDAASATEKAPIPPSVDTVNATTDANTTRLDMPRCAAARVARATDGPKR